MKVLILGAGGNLGGELVKVYADEDVFGWDRGDLDVLDVDLAEEKIVGLAPDLILNCVAYNDLDSAEGDGREMCERLNVEVPGVLAGIAERVGARFVHFSSGYVFGGDEEGGYEEGDDVLPLSVYAQSKLDGEVAAMRYENTYIIRLNWLFGPAGVSESSKESFVDKMLRLADGRDSLSLVDDESASPVYSVDLAWRTREIVAGEVPGVYHVCNSGSCTWKELAEAAFEISGINIDTEAVSGASFERAASRPLYSELKTVKMAPLRGWREALEDYLNH